MRDRVRHVREFSDDAHAAVDGSIDLLYVDGAHRYAPARADIRDWGRTGGGRAATMLIHDSFSSIGVTLAIVRELLFGRRFRYIGRSRSLAVVPRRPHAPGSGRACANAGRQLAQLPWFAKNLALKVLLTAAPRARVLRRVTGRRPEWPY